MSLIFGEAFLPKRKDELSQKRFLGSDGLAVRDSGRWVTEKLYYLDRYLDIFSVGMKNKWPGKLYYVDLFAGPGKCRIRETGEEIDGSPLIALKYDFSEYFFFETDHAYYQALKTRIDARSPGKKVHAIPRDCNATINEITPPSSPSLGVAFVDPTGVSPIAFETIRKLTQNRKIDLIINFSEGMGIRMNIHQYTKKEESALDVFMGSDEWRHNFKKAPSSIDEVCRTIINEYRDNLRHSGYRVIDGEQIPIKTSGNVLLYRLLFASKDPKGNEFWRKIGIVGPHGQRTLF